MMAHQIDRTPRLTREDGPQPVRGKRHRVPGSGVAHAVARALRRFKRDRKGVSAVEFGLVSVPFLGLFCAIFETGFVYLNSVGLDAAVQTAARNILTGNAQLAGVNGTVTSAAQFRTTYLCPSTGPQVLPSFITCANLIIDVRPATSFASADTTNDFYSNTSNQEFCPGAPGTITIVRVAYPMPVFLQIVAKATSLFDISAGLVSNVPNLSGTYHLLMATSVFQTEPYSAASYTKLAGC